MIDLLNQIKAIAAELDKGEPQVRVFIVDRWHSSKWATVLYGPTEDQIRAIFGVNGDDAWRVCERLGRHGVGIMGTAAYYGLLKHATPTEHSTHFGGTFGIPFHMIDSDPGSNPQHPN